MKESFKRIAVGLCAFIVLAAGIVFAEDTPTEYSWLTVNFKLPNDDAIATAYKGNFEAAKEYPAVTVSIPRFPTYNGYMPTLPTEPTATGLDFDFQGSDYKFTYSFDGTQTAGDINIDIVFVPILNVYKVEYYHQKLSDSTQFEKVATEAFSGMTGSTVDLDAIVERHTANGFVMREFNAPTIAADGSTVVKVFYDRLYYKLSFDTNGAVESAATQYLPYGATVGTIATPTKPGYTLTGWSPSIPETMPAQNMTCTAQWALASDNAVISIVVWGENSNDDNYSYLSTSKVLAPVDSSYTFNASSSQIYTCGKTAHTHTSDCLCCDHQQHTAMCYRASSDTPSTSITNDLISNFSALNGGLVSGRVYRNRRNNTNTYWLYYEGQWYDAPSSAAGTEIARNGQTYRVYQNAGLNCTHTHTASCYLCGLEEHTHSNACLLDTSLYTVNTTKSDSSTTVKADGSSVLNVYLDRKAFTLTMKYNRASSYSSTYNSTGTITAKWGKKIATEWLQMSTSAQNSKWSRNTNGNSPWTEFLEIMPSEDRTYYMGSTSGSAQVAKYEIQDLDDESNYTQYTEVTIKSSGTVRTTVEDQFPIEGFTYVSGGAVGSNYGGSTFRYTRNTYKLVLNNGKENVGEIDVKYEQTLENVSAFTAYGKENPPDMPNTIPASYEFVGWSLAPNNVPDETLSSRPMPAANLILYACWKKPEYEVLAYESDETSGEHFEEVVVYGDKVVGLDEPTRENYEFIGWFYIGNDGQEHAFDPATMSVFNDMTLHAKWRNLATGPYTVNFVEQGTENVLAPQQTGTATMDTTFNVTPKQIKGYFPTVADKSITMTEDATNSITFEYIKVNNVPYMVKYVDEDDTEIATSKIVSPNALDVVTEKYISITDYIVHDAFLTRYLTVTSSDPQPEDNVIKFVYSHNTTDIMVTVEYWINMDLTGTAPDYQLCSYTQDVMAYEEGKAVTITPLSITNYELNTTLSDPATKNMPATKGDMSFVFKYDPEVVTVTYHDGVTSGEDGILQSTQVLIGSKTPTYVSANPIHPTDPSDYIFDDVLGFRDSNGDKPSITATEDATYYAQWAGVFHVHHCVTGEPADDDVVETIRVDAFEDSFDVTTAVDDVYNGITDDYLYGGLMDEDGNMLTNTGKDGVQGLALEPEIGDHIYVREVPDVFMDAKTLGIRVKGLYYMTLVCVIDDPDKYVTAGFDVGTTTPWGDLTDYVYDRLVVNMVGGTQKIYAPTQIINDSSINTSKAKLICFDVSNLQNYYTEPLGFTPYYVTMDSVKVYGKHTRKVTPSASELPSWENSDCTTKPAAYTVPTSATATIKALTSYITGNENDAVTLTMVAGNDTWSEAVEAGSDCTAVAGTPDTDEALFGGWFADPQFTVPADLANVTEDTTIYARLLQGDYLTVSYATDETGALRLVSAVDTIAADKFGFKCIIGAAITYQDVDTTCNLFDGKSAEDIFGITDANAALITCDLDANAIKNDTRIRVTPYWVAADGSKVYGTTRTITIVNTNAE